MVEKPKNKKIKSSKPEPDDKFHTLYKTMPLGVVYQDSKGVIISSNPAAEKILGLTHDEMMERTSLDPGWKCIHEDGSEYPGETHPSMVALRTGKPVHNAIMGVFHPGEKKHHWILINATPLFNPGESVPFSGIYNI